MQRDAAGSLARGGRSSRWSRSCQHCLPELAQAVARTNIHTYRRRHGLAKDPILCAHCGAPFAPCSSTAAFCITKCRVAAHRAKAAGG